MIFAGYVGEFGWEIATFYPKVVALSRQKVPIELHTFPTAFGLYRDLPRVTCVDHRLCHRRNYGGADGVFPDLDLSRYEQVLLPRDSRNTVQVEGVLREPRADVQPDSRFAGCVAVHARRTDKHPLRAKQHRDWRTQYEQIFYDSHLPLVCIGEPDAAATLEDAVDLRHEPFETQLGALKAARLCVGPASGPMVLALWCRTPVYMWGDNKARTLPGSKLARVWNPFGTPSFHPWSKRDTVTSLEKKYMSHRYVPEVRELLAGLEYALEKV